MIQKKNPCLVNGILQKLELKTRSTIASDSKQISKM
jgi:hypothetical protein